MGFQKEADSSSHALDAPMLPSYTAEAGGHLSSQAKTFANVFIAIVGAGVLGLPYTYMRTGWVAGVLMLLAVAAGTFHCMMLLVSIRRRLDDSSSSKIGSFGDLGHAVSGPLGRLAVDAMIVLSQAGFCVSYLIFIANTLTHLRPIVLPFAPSLSAKAIYIWAMLPFQLGLNSIKTLTLLAPLSIFADVVDLGAMGVVLWEDVAAYVARGAPPLRTFAGPSVILYGLGVSVYSFEGIGMVLPLESEAADKSKFGRTLAFSMTFIALLYGLFGALGYFAFGNDTRDIITTNLGSGLLTVVVQLGLCINLFFTFPVMMNPVYEVGVREALLPVAPLSAGDGRQPRGHLRPQLRGLPLPRRQQRLLHPRLRASGPLPPEGLRVRARRGGSGGGRGRRGSGPRRGSVRHVDFSLGHL